MNELLLNLARQTHREPVDVDFPRLDPFGFKKNLMPLLVGEADDLVLERRTVPRTDAANLTVEQGRAREIRAHELVHAIGRVQKMTVDLRAVDSPGQKRKGNRRIVAQFAQERAALDLALEIDASRDRAAEACRSSADPIRSRTT